MKNHSQCCILYAYRCYFSEKFTGVVSLCTGETFSRNYCESVKSMDLLQCKITCSAAAEEVHIFAESLLPDCGELFSVIPSCPDSGSCVFTVNTCGISDFIVSNTCDIFLTINTFYTPGDAFFFTHLSAHSSQRVQKQKRFTRSSGLSCTQVKLQKRAVLRHNMSFSPALKGRGESSCCVFMFKKINP